MHLVRFSVFAVSYWFQWKFEYAVNAQHGVAKNNLAKYYQAHRVTEARKAMGSSCGGLVCALRATASAERK